jgi:hypothetical protein
MNELELLFLVLAVVYLWESAAWLRWGTVGFMAYWDGRWSLVHPAALLGNQGGGIILANPLPPLGTFLAGGQSPLSISPEGVFSYVAQCVNPGWRPPQTANYVRFDAMQKIEASGKKIRVNGKVLLKTGSPLLARQLAAELLRLAKLPVEKRAAAIQERVEAALDAKAVEARLAGFLPLARPVRQAANALFAYLFLALPLWISCFGFRRDWPFMLAALLLLTGTAAVFFNRGYQKLYPDADEERFTHWFMILFSPATAVRAQDALSRPLLESFHPLAVAQVLLTPEKFREFARRVLLELRHPCLPVCPTVEAEPQAAERHARTVLLAAVEGFLKRHGADPTELAAAPARADESCQSYCPRCRAQFTTEQGTCADCGGMPLVALPERAERKADEKRAT